MNRFAKKYGLLVSVALFACGYGMTFIKIPIFETWPININVSIEACLFMYIGHKYTEKIMKLSNIVFGIFGLIAVLLACWNGNVNLASPLWGKNIYIMVFDAIVLSFLVIRISFIIKSNSLFEFWGRNAVIFMAFDYFCRFTFLPIIGGKLKLSAIINNKILVLLSNLLVISILSLLISKMRKK